MPVEFLTDEQAAAYGAFGEAPTRPELERFFFLDDDDRDLIALRRSDGHRLGMAVQICTVRYIGTFLGDDPLAVPWEVVDYLAGQLGIEDSSCVKQYAERRMTPYNHAQEIRERFGYRDYSDRKWSREFRTFLYGRAWTHAEGPVALFNHAVTWLRRNRVLLPSVSVLARQVSEARTVAERRLYETVATAAQKADRTLAPALVALLEVPEGKRVSELERLRTPPTKSTGTAMARAMERMEEISVFGLGRVNLSRVPVNRLNTLARYGQLSKAQTIERAREPRKTALLTAVVRNLEAQAVDDALDLFALLMANRLINPARRASDKERLAVLPQLEKAARTLARVSKILVEGLDLGLDRVAEHDADLDVAALWAAVEEAVPRAAVSGAVAMVEALVPEDDGSAEATMREKLALRYNTVRPFLPLLGESNALGAAQGGKRILRAVRRLPALSRRQVKERPLLPREVDAELVPAMWRHVVFSNAKLPQGAVNRDAYVVCVLEQLHGALNRRDIFAAPSNRWADPRTRLLDGPRWEAMRADVLAGLSLNEYVGAHLTGLTGALDAAWRQMADRLAEAGEAAKVEIVVPEGGGRARLSVDKLGAVGEPESLAWLKATTEAMLPRIDPPDLLFEVHSWTGFLDAFKHVSARPHPYGRTSGQPGGTAGVGELQHRADASDRPEREGADPLAPVARGPELPRADVPRPDSEEPDGDYGPLEAIARNKVNLKRIETHWPDMLRGAGSLITNQIRAYDLLRMSGREGHPTPLGQAFAEYGRIDKTMHLLALVDPVDDTYRRLMNRQLTVQESRHRLARAICHGGRGQIRQAYREGQEDQLASLGLVLNAVALWNTRYLDAAVAQLRAEGHNLKGEDVARLSPLKDRHINFLGRYQFNFAASGPRHGLRPLRDPGAPEDVDPDNE